MRFLLKALIGIVILGGLGGAGLGFMSQTPPEDLGLSDGTLRPCPSSPNCASSLSAPSDRSYAAPFSPTAWDAIPSAVEKTGGVVISQSDTYIHAEYTSKLVRYVDDVEFLKAADAVHVRSASRVGYGDQDANKNRVAALRHQLGE